MISCTCCLPSIYWRDMIWRDKLTELNRQTQRPLARRSPLDLHRWEKQIQERPRRMRRLGHKKRRHIGLQTSPQFSPILSTTLLFSSAIFQFARSEQRDVESMWAIPWRCGHVCIMHYCKQFWFQFKCGATLLTPLHPGHFHSQNSCEHPPTPTPIYVELHCWFSREHEMPPAWKNLSNDPTKLSQVQSSNGKPSI